MTPDYDAIEKFARAATPWTSEDCCAMFDPSPNGPDQYRVGPNVYDCEKYTNWTGEIPPQASRDERFVAHANPTAILEMIAHARLQEERIGKLREGLKEAVQEWEYAESCICIDRCTDLKCKCDGSAATAEFRKKYSDELAKGDGG